MKLRMDAFGPCLAQIAERGRMTDGEAKQILQETVDRAELMRMTGEPDAFVQAASELAGRMKETAKRNQVDALRNAAARNKILAEIDTAGGIKTAASTLRDLMHGTNKGSRDSIEAQWKGLTSSWQAALSWQLHSAGIEKAAVSGAMDKDIARELWDLRKIGPSKPEGATGNNPARQAAQAVVKIMDNVKDRLNEAGARIADATDYVAHTEHDARRMRAAGGAGATPDQAFGAWWKAEQPRWSEETFRDLTSREGETQQQARDRFGRSVFDALVSGRHMTPDGAFGIKDDTYVPPAFEGTRNIAKKLSQPRVIHYKDADAWLDHMQQFGSSSSLVGGVMGTLDSSARSLSLMERLGTNPTANFNQIIDRVQDRYRSDLDGLAAFKDKISGLNNVMGRLDGSLNIPANEMWASIGATTRTMETTSSLGGVGVTHFASIWPTVTSELVHHGVPRLQTVGQMVKALFQGRGTEERRELMADLGAYSAGLSRDMFNRWQPDSPIPGKVSAIANTFMKYTGIHYVFDNTQAAVREMLAHQLGRRSADTAFEALDPNLQLILGKYGLGKPEWDLLRTVPDMTVSEGRRYMTPKDPMWIDPQAAQAYLRERGVLGPETAQGALDGLAGGQEAETARQVQKLGQTLSDRLNSYYSDAANHAVVTPGVRERAMLLGSTRPGSLGGELLRYVTQFKMWPVAAMHQLIGREIYTSLSTKQAVWNLGVMAAMSAAAGYLRMTVNDVARGSPVRNPFDPKTALAGLAQGGGMGILGDFLFGETNRMGGGFMDVAAGPVLSDADKLIQLFTKARGDVIDPSGHHHKNGQFGDLWPDLAHFAVRHVPFANLVYVKGALDYLAFYHLYEAASPGWWERTNRRIQKEQGRTMAGYSPGAGVPYGVPGVYLRGAGGQSSGLLAGFGGGGQ